MTPNDKKKMKKKKMPKKPMKEKGMAPMMQGKKMHVM